MTREREEARERLITLAAMIALEAPAIRDSDFATPINWKDIEEIRRLLPIAGRDYAGMRKRLDELQAETADVIRERFNQMALR